MAFSRGKWTSGRFWAGDGMEPAQVVEVCKAGGQVLWSNQRKWFQVVFRRRPAARYQSRPGQVQFHQEEFSTSQGRSLSDSQKKVEVQVKAQVEQVKFQV